MSSDHGSDIHFFKRIEEYTLRNGELVIIFAAAHHLNPYVRIPRSFVKRFWEEISNPLFLLLPNCAKWEVNWTKIDGDVWLIDKWKKFAEFFSLDQDHLLVFRYVGKSQFKIVILDRGGLEIVYPLMEGSLDGADIGGSFFQRKRAKFSVPSSPSTKKVKINPSKKPNSYPTRDVETKYAESQRTKVELKKFSGDHVDERGRRRNMRCSSSKANTFESKELLEDTETGTALERANSFHSENPFFIRQMHRSYIFHGFLSMPANFITGEQRNGKGRVSLWISEDRSWDVNFSFNRRGVKLSSGWADFVKDNNLKIGNVCVFEKIKKPGISFRVLIFRDPQESSPSNFSDSEFPRCDNEIPENQFALLVRQNVCIPEQFIRNHKMDNAAKVRLRVGTRAWGVKLDHDPKHKYHKLSDGWSTFISECKLNEGDVCKFELVDEDMFIFQVRVARCID